MPNKLLFGGWAKPIEAKTAAYTVKERDCGKVFTNRGAGGSVTFTLPIIQAGLKGFWVEFYQVAAQVMIVACPAASNDKMVFHALVDGKDIRLGSTIGQHLTILCDGTGWLVVSDPSAAAAATAVTAVPTLTA